MSGPLYPVAILAGGLAIRLLPQTATAPKALVDVNGEPFIGHQLRLLRANGVERVVICGGYLGEMIHAFVGNGGRFGLEVEFSFDGPRPLGTGGAVRKALPLLGEAFFVLYGDSYLTCDYRTVQAEFERRGKLGLMTVFRNDDRWDRSNVTFSDGTVLAYDKRNRTAAMHHIDYGLGVLRRAAFDRLADGEPSDLADLYRELVERGKLAGYEVDQRFFEIGSFVGLEEMRNYLGAQRQHSAP